MLREVLSLDELILPRVISGRFSLVKTRPIFATIFSGLERRQGWGYLRSMGTTGRLDRRPRLVALPPRLALKQR